MKHLVCSKCNILLECDWMGISVDYEDYCPKGHENYHVQQEVNCDCESKVTING